MILKLDYQQMTLKVFFCLYILKIFYQCINKQIFQNGLKKIFKQIRRPFSYAGKTGSSQKSQTGRANIGGQITGVSSNVIVNQVDTISMNNFDNHLRSKGLPNSAVDCFQCLKYVQTGSRSQKSFELKRDNAYLEVVAAAVHRISQNEIQVAIYWVRINVSFQQPQTMISYVTRHYGFGYRQSDNSHQYIGRGLSEAELSCIKTRLRAQSQNMKIDERAMKMLK